MAERCPPAETIVAMLEGLLEPEERARLDAHVEACPECAILMVELGRSFSTSPEAPSDASLPTIGRFQILEEIGRGGMGVVYRAFDETLQREVAVKLLRADRATPEARREHAERMLREARLLATVRHPNVLTIYEAGWREARADGIYLATELIEGETVSAWIARAAPDWREILEVYRAAAEGLAAAHAAGVIHRDIKPSNLLLSADGRVVLVDFGLARAERAGAGEPPAALTRTGSALGTPAYMSPEQHLGCPADARSDLFSLAASIYTSLYGQRPFGGETASDIALEVCRGALRPPPASSPVPSRIGRALAAGMAQDPSARFPDVMALMSALERAAAPRRRGSWVLLIGAALLLASIGGRLAFDSSRSEVSAAQEASRDARATQPVTPPSFDASPPGAPTEQTHTTPATPTPIERARPAPASSEQLVPRMSRAIQAFRAQDAQGCLSILEGVKPEWRASLRAQCLALLGRCDEAEVELHRYPQPGVPVEPSLKNVRRLCRPSADEPEAELIWMADRLWEAHIAGGRCAPLIRGILARASLEVSVKARRHISRHVKNSLGCLAKATPPDCALARATLEAIARLEGTDPRGAQTWRLLGRWFPSCRPSAPEPRRLHLLGMVERPEVQQTQDLGWCRRILSELEPDLEAPPLHLHARLEGALEDLSACFAANDACAEAKALWVRAATLGVKPTRVDEARQRAEWVFSRRRDFSHCH